MQIWESKLLEHFPDAVVDKGLMIKFDGLRLPRFVSEYLVMDYISRFGESEGLAQMEQFLEKHYPKPNSTDYYHYHLQQEGEISIVDNFKISVNVEKHGDDHTLTVPALNLQNAKVHDKEIIEENPRLLSSGLWGMGKITKKEGQKRVFLTKFRPFQVSKIDMGYYKNAMEQFSTVEWMDAMVSSIGFNPNVFNTTRKKLVILSRLLPLVQKSIFLYEFGPPGTGKTYIFDRLSNNSFVISGSKITPAKLFRDVRTRQEGLLRQFDALLFDEIDKISDSEFDDEIVNKLLKFMESNTFDRGGVEMTSHSSLIFSGNLKVAREGEVPDFFAPLAQKLKGEAFLDRFSGVIPGWEIKPLSKVNENFTKHLGFSADYFSAVLSELRHEEWENRISSMIEFSKNTTNRDEKAILKTVSGLLKLTFPNNRFDQDIAQEIIDFAVELRQLIINQRFSLYGNKDDARELSAVFIGGNKYEYS